MCFCCTGFCSRKKNEGMEQVKVWMRVHFNRDGTMVVKSDTRVNELYFMMKCLDEKR